jgi:microsomal dipeptidase-like Zn-dependent dipeptidase
MQEDDALIDLIDLVKNIGKIYDEEGISINIDFDYNDGIIMIKYQNDNSKKVTCIINTNNKTISGIDTTKFWLPDYSKTQKANKKMIQLLEKKGYSLSNITYRKK